MQKRYLLLLALVILGFTLCACSDGPPPQQNKTEYTPEATREVGAEQYDQEAAINEKSPHVATQEYRIVIRGRALAYLILLDGKFAPGECICYKVENKVFLKWKVDPINQNQLVYSPVRKVFFLDPKKEDIIITEVEIPRYYQSHPESWKKE